MWKRRTKCSASSLQGLTPIFVGLLDLPFLAQHTLSYPDLFRRRFLYMIVNIEKTFLWTSIGYSLCPLNEVGKETTIFLQTVLGMFREHFGPGALPIFRYDVLPK